MDAVIEFLRMGGHGAYVWSAYGLSLLVLAAGAVQSVCREARLLRELSGDGKR